MFDRKVRFDSQQIRERSALLIGKLTAEMVGIEDSLALRLRHLAQVAESPGDESAAILGETHDTAASLRETADVAAA